MYDGVHLFFYRIGNCAKNRAASTVRFRMIELFGSGSGHCPLFFFLVLTIHNDMAIMGTNVCVFANKRKKKGEDGWRFPV